MKFFGKLNYNFARESKIAIIFLFITFCFTPLFSIDIFKNNINTISSCDSTVANFTLNSDTQCFVGNSFSFTNKSYTNFAGGDIYYAWSYNSTTSVKKNIKTTFNKPGSYKVTLTITDDNGCSSSINKTVVVLGLKLSIS